MRAYWSRMGFAYTMIGVLTRRGECTQTHRHKERTPCEDGGKDWSESSISQGTPKMASNTRS